MSAASTASDTSTTAEPKLRLVRRTVRYRLTIRFGNVPSQPEPFPRPAHPFAWEMIGDSMAPLIRPGERVEVTPYEPGRRSIDADGIYLVRLEDVVQLRQVQKVPGALRVSCVNERFGSYDARPGDDVEIVGRLSAQVKHY